MHRATRPTPGAKALELRAAKAIHHALGHDGPRGIVRA